MTSFKVRNGNTITLTYMGGGATAENVIWVSEQNKNTKEPVLIDRIDGFDYTYLIKFSQLSDSILILSLTDTIYRYGEIKFEINLKNRIVPNDGYRGAKRLD